VRTYLGIDGGGTKTAFLLIDESGRVLGSYLDGPAYYLETGWGPMKEMLARGIQATLGSAGVAAANLEFAFLGLPAYGEDSGKLAELDCAPSPALQQGRYRCGNDAVCGWAGALACQDGINVIAGTGSMAYGEYGGRSARAGGWGELFSDEGSAYWIAREGLRLFARMADGRSERGPLYEILRTHFGLQADLDLCAAVYGDSPIERSQLASWAGLIAQAADSGDALAGALFEQGAEELRQIVQAVDAQLGIPKGWTIPVSYSGGLFKQPQLLKRLLAKLDHAGSRYFVVPPRLPPVAGAALYAAKVSGAPLPEAGVQALEAHFKDDGRNCSDPTTCASSQTGPVRC
jgi:N-acetylglucosamine kinase-like BadF-type ATPase